MHYQEGLGDASAGRVAKFMVTKEKQRRSLWGELNRRHALRLYAFTNEFHNVIHGSAGLEDSGHADFL